MTKKKTMYRKKRKSYISSRLMSNITTIALLLLSFTAIYFNVPHAINCLLKAAAIVF